MPSNLITFPAPRRGWISNSSFVQAPLDAAEVLDNFFPTAQGAVLRAGTQKHATLDAAAAQCMAYHSGGAGELFASTSSDIYDVTNPADPDTAETPVVSGLATGDWSSQQFSTAGGDYLINVNGSDHLQIYDGVTFEPVANVAINEVPYDALTTDFTVGEIVTGGTSGATATIIGVNKTSATAGTLKVGTITGGPYQDNEALTSASGSATANGASSAGSTLTITNVATSALSQVWAFKNRLWFIEENTLSAWYLPTNSIAGAAVEFPLRGIFNKGGSVLFGATWSLDAGDGIDDVIVFVTDQGEAAVYTGTDPSVDFALSGVYQVGVPLSKHAAFKAGGDLVIGSESGLIPLSSALRKDLAAIEGAAITYPIEDAWREAVTARTSSSPITMTLWSDENRLMVGTPALSGSDNVAFVANARTGAWCRYTGFDVLCATVMSGGYYFGTSDGTIMKAETGGNDNESPYAGLWVPKFQEGDAKQKSGKMARFRGRGEETYEIGLAIFKDYEISDLTSATATSEDLTSAWGTGVWGVMVWGGAGYKSYLSEWQSTPNFGTALAPVLRVEINRSNAPTLECIAIDAIYEGGKVL